jgi:hypothetical protein
MGARARLALLVTFGVLVALPALADQKWLRLESTSFVVVGATDERTLKNIASHLEQFRETFATLMPTSRASVALPAVVVVFPSQRAYKPFWPLYEGKPRPSSGLFLRSEDANYISLNAEYGEQVYKLVYHEYTHFITSKLFAAPPFGWKKASPSTTARWKRRRAATASTCEPVQLSASRLAADRQHVHECPRLRIEHALTIPLVIEGRVVIGREQLLERHLRHRAGSGPSWVIAG